MAARDHTEAASKSTDKGARIIGMNFTKLYTAETYENNIVYTIIYHTFGISFMVILSFKKKRSNELSSFFKLGLKCSCLYWEPCEAVSR